jgi:hypothetical protein
MINLADISRALNAVWLLFLDRAGAIQMFDTSIDGFWKSFQAILLVIPIYAVSVLADEQAYRAVAAPDASFDAATFYVSRAVTLAFDWVTMPVLLALLAPFLGVRGGYTAYIVVRNWSVVLTLIPFAAISMLELAGLLRGEAILFPAGIALAISLRIAYLAARRALAVPIDMAIGFVAFDFLVSLGIARAAAYTFGIEA